MPRDERSHPADAQAFAGIVPVVSLLPVRGGQSAD